MRRAFSLAELLVVLLILGILWAGGMGLAAWPRRTARQETEQAMKWLYGIFLRADRTKRSFSLRVENGLKVTWGTFPERLRASEGFSFTNHSGAAKESVYSVQWGTVTPGLTVRVQGPEEDVYYLIISGQGRLRVSESPPDGD